MNLGRRKFIKLSAMTAAATAFGGLGFDLRPSEARAQLLKINWAQETTSICCFCAVGCGMIVHTAKEGFKRCINVEGDPDHPINQGSLCAKGSSAWQVCENHNRPPVPMYRAPYSDKWEEVSWDWALDKIAIKTKEARDSTLAHKNSKGQVVNRCEGLASVGSAALDNEECWIFQAFLRALGLVWIEHQARI